MPSTRKDRMTRTTRYALMVLAVAAALAAPVHAQLPGYAPPKLQARTNLLVNDNGYNLPPGSSFNSISADIDDGGRVSFPVQVVPNGASSSPGVWFGPGDGSGSVVFYGPVDSLISSSLRINNDGLAVFTLFDTVGQDGIWRYDHATQQAARIGTSPVFPNSYGNPGINAAAQIGFQANFAGGRAYASVVPGAGALIHVADRGI